MSKRDDIQWLRAVAIFAVLFFHLKPKLFPLGYLGVDMFFVISGYLMTSILSKKDISISTFYLSRIKRIFPCYLFLIAIVLGFGYYFLLPSDYDGLKTETIWSIFFSNNLYPIFHQKEYFEMVSEYKFLLHSWSLGVEIQFYLIAPFLIKFILSKENCSFLITVAILISTFLLQLISKEEMAFGFTICRIWQFLIGTLAFILNKQNSDTNVIKKKSFIVKYLILLSLIIICFLPFNFKNNRILSSIICTVCTILTGSFILLNPFQNLMNRGNSAIKNLNDLMVYFGDASYIMYLLHWPLIVYFKYLDISWPICAKILLIFLLTIILHECFEKNITSRTLKFNGIIIGIFYFIIITFLYISPKNHDHIFLTEQMISIQENEKQFESCKSIISRTTVYQKTCQQNELIEKYFTFRPPKHKYDYLKLYCSFKLNPEGNLTALIIGNSFVSFEIGSILDALKKSKNKYSEVFVLSQAHCCILIGNLTLSEPYCNGIVGSHDALLEILKPDIIIHTGRYIRFIGHESDLDLLKRSILHISKFTRRLVILEPSPRLDSLNFTNPSTISHALYTNEPLDQYKMTVQTHHAISKRAWDLTKAATGSCSNCFLVETQHLFCDEKYCPIVDPKSNVSRYCDKEHITPTESLRLSPLILQAIDS